MLLPLVLELLIQYNNFTDYDLWKYTDIGRIDNAFYIMNVFLISRINIYHAIT